MKCANDVPERQIEPSHLNWPVPSKDALPVFQIRERMYHQKFSIQIQHLMLK
jgi:hypothetical protein